MNQKYKKPTPEELKNKLTPQQYLCTQENGTERPFENPYWNNKSDGIYVDVVSGEPLFSSIEKYDSGTGWPSFFRPLEAQNLVLREDHELGVPRVEVRSRSADSHLGHVFDDGPQPTGVRFCMNSAALRFIPLEELKQQGYGQYLFHFAKKKGWEISSLAGGCFWGMEDLIEKIPGVIETQVGYTGGKTKEPVYPAVKTGQTGHAEAIQILFDPRVLSFESLLLEYFKLHDPTTQNRQGNDIGSQYRSAIFYYSDQQRETAQKVKERVAGSHAWKNPIVTEIVPATEFWRAEEEHQKYLKQNPGGYTCHFYRKVEF